MSEEKSGQAAGDLDLQALLKKSHQETSFPDVPLDEFEPPTYEEWKEACIALLKGAPFDKKMYTKTYEGITFSPMYFRADTDSILPKKSFPGLDDYLRGAKPNGYIEAPWGIAQSCDETMPKENNELLKHEIDRGSTIYNIRLDRATLSCVDAGQTDKPGDDGCSITTLQDVHDLLDGLKLDTYPLYIYAGESALPVFAMVIAALKASGRDIGALRGIIAANPVGELVARGKNSQSLDKLYDEAYECGKWAIKNTPQLRTLFVKSDVFSNGGANDIQEIAYSLSVAVDYLRAMMERGMTVDEAAGQIAFEFSMGANFFMQIAKLRAVRPIWAQIVEAFGGNEDSRKMYIHARPSRFFKTVYDPYVNMLRNTSEIFSGVVGGLDSFENPPFDEVIRKGDEFSRRIARNVQIMLQEEFGLLQPIDPAGGSWAVETLTKQVKEKLWAEFQTVEGKGGIVAALKEGYPQEQIAGILADRFKKLELRRDRIVGSNMYPNMTEVRLDPRPEDFGENKKLRCEAVSAYINDVDVQYRDEALSKIKETKGSMDCVISAAKAGATVSELKQALTCPKCAEAAEEIEKIGVHRWSERYEALRMVTEAYKEKHDDNVRIFLANMGPIPQHKARADFTTGFLQVGAFEVMGNNGFKTVEEAAAAAKESGADAVVICSTDATYPEIVPALAPMLHEALPQATVFLAGEAPKDLKETYDAAGINSYISVRANCYEILQALQKKKGMIE
ncbi:MAG: acyl-CoA mutase large subunit family protein [Anaerovibrio sp.]|uniref:methylmalonyl-CoA mutase family protein n=1 Tax=Anaerovibrio sp. TaxID=1872532 RepID=UPI0025ED2671|nr:methylmalonyl-CoA mutase family protein [Anaerovibrio sp.]MCR5175379.1 acyl-CoA mutase large subunit family protein [Anaerovibrio sp.]